MTKDINNKSELKKFGVEPVDTVKVPVIKRFIEDEYGNLIGVTASGIEVLLMDTPLSSSDDDNESK